MITRWDVITIGNLSRNRYWGEGDERAVRDAWCTSTLITGGGFKLLVDPALKQPAEMTRELDRRAGLKPEAIDAVFVTHHHDDHHWGLETFPHAQWWAAREVASLINENNSYLKRVEPASPRLFDEIGLIHTPGHTAEHHGLVFGCGGQTVVIAGDAVMTRDFYAHRQGYFNSVSFETAAQTIEEIGRIADVVVPGHDNCFLVELTPFVTQ
jgi:glyoxylase-like metal-dependent hydrolase (beta-lactamase superfamily II)